MAFYHNNLGLCFYHLSRTCEEDNNIMAQANYHFTKAISWNCNNPIHFFNRGNVYLNLKEFQAAHTDYDESLALDANNPKFYHAKGLACQNEADLTSDKERETVLVHQAIDFFGHAVKCSETFYASILHQGLMFRRI